MGNYYHYKAIKQLTIGQSLDGERTPIFNVVLEPGAMPACSADVENNPGEHLYVFGDFGKLYAYLPAPNEDVKEAYRTVMSDHLKFKLRKVEPA